jgi:hypothetical protein
MKHLMVRLHLENANVVTELKRRGINRRTWFDSKWRYRGVWNTTWGGDHDYIVYLVRKLIEDAKTAEMFVSRSRSTPGSSSAHQPVHRSAEEALKRIADGHSASFEDARKLRGIANNSAVTKALSAAEISTAKPVPLVVNLAIESHKRPTTSLSWEKVEEWDYRGTGRRSVHYANRQLQEISCSKEPFICACGCGRLKLALAGKLRWFACESCGKSVGNSWVERRQPVRR